MQATRTAPDLDLVEQAARNDQAAPGALYERHLAAPYDYARRLMRTMRTRRRTSSQCGAAVALELLKSAEH